MSKLNVLKKINEEIYNRILLIEKAIKHPSVIVEFQSFFHIVLKLVLNSINEDFGIFDKNPTLKTIIKNSEFTNYVNINIGYYDSNLVFTIDKLANKHKHSHHVEYDADAIKQYYKLVYQFSFALCRFFKIEGDTPTWDDKEYDRILEESEGEIRQLNQLLQENNETIDKHFNEIQRLKNDRDRLEESNSILRDEIASKIQALEELVEKQKDLKDIIINEKYRNEKQFKQIIDLSKIIIEDKPQKYWMMVQPSKLNQGNFYDDAIRAKRSGDFSRALWIYKEEILNGGNVDLILLNSIFKSAFLNNNYELAKRCLLAYIHLELSYSKNIFYKIESNKLDIFDENWIDRLNYCMEIHKNTIHYLIENGLPKYLFSITLLEEPIFRYYMCELAEEEPDEIVLLSFRKSLQFGKFDSIAEKKHLDEFMAYKINEEKFVGLVDNIINYIQLNDLDNILVVDIYQILGLFKLY